MTVELVIEELGAQGDGIAAAPGTPQGTVYVPFTLPGERVRARLQDERGELIEVLTPSPDRQPPVCRHFGLCGGCALEHMRASAYLAWKRAQVEQAFAQRGLAPAVKDVVPVPQGARRRTALAARRTRSGVLLGCRQRFRHDIVDLSECAVLRPAIVAVLPGLRALLGPLLSRRGEARVTLLETETGLDVAIDGVREPEGPSALAQLSTLAEELDLARLILNGEPALLRRQPLLTFGGIKVAPPPGAFLQATAEAEREMTTRVLRGLAGAGRVADLFAGLGTFALSLAAEAQVLAVDLDAPSLQALDEAARGAMGLKALHTLHRDLFREPLSAKELQGFDGLVFDPPRAGAHIQAEEIVRSAVPKVVAVSCNPATLARDARVLVDGGYRLLAVEPIDQFLYSAHIEAVASFVRA